MSDGKIPPNSDKIIEYPENYEDMKEKYLQREKEQVGKLKERSESEDLVAVAKQAITKRSTRTDKDHKPLADRTVITESPSKEIKELKTQLNEEIKQISARVFGALPEEDIESLESKILGDLKGRVSKKPPSSGAGS